MDKDRWTTYVCCFVGLFISLLVVGISISIQSWRLSALVRMEPSEPMASVAREHDLDFAFVRDGHYDGVYFYAVALDPLARGAPSELIDHGVYRYGHPGYGWLAFLVSMGRAERVPLALALIGILGMTLGSGFASVLAGDLGYSRWGGLVIACNPGMIYAVSSDTSEPIGACILAAALILWRRRALWLAGLLLALLCFVKEIFLLIPLALFVWELLRDPGEGSPRRARLSVLVAVPLPLLGWWAYLVGNFDQIPFLRSPEVLSWPVVGWLDSMQKAAKLGLGSEIEAQIGVISLALMVAIAALLLIGSAKALAMRNFLHPIFLALMLVTACLTWLGTLFPKDLFRVLAPQLALLPAVLVMPTGHRR